MMLQLIVGISLLVLSVCLFAIGRYIRKHP